MHTNHPKKRDSEPQLCPCQSVTGWLRNGELGNTYCPGARKKNNGAAVLCSACVHRALRGAQSRHRAALQQHEVARRECSDALQRMYEEEEGQGSCQILEWQAERRQLTERLEFLRRESSQAAAQVIHATVQNQERKELFLNGNPESSSSQPLEHLHRLQAALKDGAMVDAITAAQNQVKMLRFLWAIQVFEMHRLDIGDGPSNDENDNSSENDNDGRNEKHRQHHKKKKERHARGIGKIGGLPLPHAGPELFGVLPPLELQSALRLVASVTSTVSRCLGIHLPHPVLLQPTGPEGDIAQPLAPTTGRRDVPDTRGDSKDELTNATAPSAEHPALSTASLASLVERSAKSALARATGNSQKKLIDEESLSQNVMVPPSMDPTVVQQRLRHAKAAVLAEGGDDSSKSSSSSSRFALSAAVMNQDEFAIALQLLQNNIVALCIRAGVPVAKLWPAEAVLLNLHALYVYCKEQV